MLVNWDNQRLTKQRMASIAYCMGGKLIAMFFKKLALDFKMWSYGMPDLVLWREDKAAIKFVEVKSENDILSEQQKCWILNITNEGVECELCQMENIQKFEIQSMGKESNKKSKKKLENGLSIQRMLQPFKVERDPASDAALFQFLIEAENENLTDKQIEEKFSQNMLLKNGFTLSQVMDLRSTLLCKKHAIRNAERLVLGLPYRPENTLAMKLKAILEQPDDIILGDEQPEDEDVFVDEDSQLPLPKQKPKKTLRAKTKKKKDKKIFPINEVKQEEILNDYKETLLDESIVKNLKPIPFKQPSEPNSILNPPADNQSQQVNNLSHPDNFLIQLSQITSGEHDSRHLSNTGNAYKLADLIRKFNCLPLLEHKLVVIKLLIKTMNETIL